MKGAATMEKSKLPVRSHAANATDVVLPCAKKPCPQKPVLPLYSKDPNIAFSSSAPDCGVFKAGGTGQVNEIGQQWDAAKEEIKELKRCADKHMMILESRNIDPVTGDNIIAAAEETSKVREETKVFTENLLKELKHCSLVTMEHKNLVQSVREKWKEAEEHRNLFLEEQRAFHSDLQQFQSALQEMA